MSNELFNDGNEYSKREIYEGVIPIIEAEEYDNTIKKAQEGDLIARLQLIHYAIFKSTDLNWFSICIKYIQDSGLNEKYSDLLGKLGAEAGKRIAREIALKKKTEKDEKFASEPHYTADGKTPNAVLINTDGSAELIVVEGFDDGEDLGAPLECSRVDKVMNKLSKWATDNFKTAMVGYVDANGMPKGLEENETIQRISGYDYIAGACVIVGIDDKYNFLPLHPYDAVSVWKYFNK